MNKPVSSIMLSRAHAAARMLASIVTLAVCGLLLAASGALAALPDGRGYELVSPVEKNGVTPYAAIPSLTGGRVDFQARGGLADSTSGGLNLYQAFRTPAGWQTTALTPTPSTPLGALEAQAPVWASPDLSQTIFTTPASYISGDEDEGALSLYARNVGGELGWVSQGTQGANEPKQITFDTATSDGTHVVFSSGASLLPVASGLSEEVFPEPEFLYERDTTTATTSLVNRDNTGHLAGYAATTLAEEFVPGGGSFIVVASTEGFAAKQVVTIGTGTEAETATIESVSIVNGVPRLKVQNPEPATVYPTGTPVVHLSEGAVLGDGAHLTSGRPPVDEYLPADAGSGSTTNAVSSDGSKVFFESPSPAAGTPVALYMRENNTTTIKIAGAEEYAITIAGSFPSEYSIFGSARFQGAAADGSLVFFTSEEGLAGATIGKEVYEFNTTSHQIGAAPPMSVHPVSTGLGGDATPTTTLTEGASVTATIHVASTTGFHAGEEVIFAPFEGEHERINSDEIVKIATIDSPTQLTLTALTLPGAVIASGTEIHGVHPASVTAISNDGSHVFFVSDGVLAENANPEGATAVPVQPNLYVYDTGTDETTFIGTLTSSDVSREGAPAGLAGEPDVSRPAVPSPDGSVLAFASAANLTGQNPWQEHTEVYRYSEGALLCLSCTTPGIKPTGDATFGETAGGTYDPPGLSSPMSESGSRIFFQTPDSLVPEDVNGGAPTSAKFATPTSTDVYEWEAGATSLISSGNSSTPTILMGTTPTGNDTLFASTAQLVPSQSDGGYENIFDARVGGGFPAAATPSSGKPTCIGSACSALGASPTFTNPASITSQGKGNLHSEASGTGTTKPLSNGQKLTKALRACKKAKSKTKRTKCERAAHHKYPTGKQAKSHKE